MNSEAVVWVLASHQGEVFRNNCAPGVQVLRKNHWSDHISRLGWKMGECYALR